MSQIDPTRERLIKTYRSMAKHYEIDNDDGITKEVGPRTNELLAG